MYLHEITIKNYSIHKETKVALSPITVFVGPNGGGKSSLFDALLNFSMLSRGNIGQAFGNYPYSFNATKHRGALSISRIAFDVLMSESQNHARQLRYKIDYAQQPQDKGDFGLPSFDIKAERLESLPGKESLFDRENPDSSPLRAALNFVRNDTGIFAAIRKAQLEKNHKLPSEILSYARDISRFNKFRLDPYKLRLPSDLPDLTTAEIPRISYDGENLASCLYYMQQTAHPSLTQVVKQVQTVLPGFVNFDFNVVANQRIGFSITFSDQRQTIPAARLSDGQLLLIGLMVLVYSENRPPVLMVEEPENGLTPPAQRAFYQAVRELAFRSDEKQRSQVLISSHSPFIICEAWNGEDRDFIHQVKVENGQTVVRKFSDAIRSAGTMLGKKNGERLDLSLKHAEELMAGYLA